MATDPNHIDYRKAYESLMQQHQQILEQTNTLLIEKDTLLAEKDTLLTEKDTLLTEKDTLLSAKDKELSDKVSQLTDKEQRIAYLHQQLDQLSRLLKSGKAERFVSDARHPAAPTLFDLPKVEEVSGEQVQVAAHTKHKKNKHENHKGRNGFPKSLRREETILLPDDVDLSFARKIGEDTTEILAYQPAELWVKRIIRPKYQDVATGTIHQAKAPARSFERSKVDVSIPAHLIMSKFMDHLPLDRQLKMFSRLGLTLSESSIYNWINTAGYFLEPLYLKHKELVLNSTYLHADETTIQVLDSDKKGATHQGYYWAYQSHVDKLVIFEYQRGRGEQGPREMLHYFKGFLQTDGYHVYESLCKGKSIVLIHCMAHARRKFYEALKNDPKRAAYALTEIQRLYAIEKHIQEKKLEEKVKLAYRKKYALPILKDFEKWMEQAIQEVLPKSPIGKALNYTLPRWERLSLYASTSLLHIDNNPVENSIRPIAIGRKNYLFAGNDKAAQRAAMFYSLLATCKLHQVNPYEWLCDVLNRLPECRMNQIEMLLPQNWKPLQKN